MGIVPSGDDEFGFNGLPLYNAIDGRHIHIIKIVLDAGVSYLERHRMRLPTLNQKDDFEQR
jgi:hypothetical protein